VTGLIAAYFLSRHGQRSSYARSATQQKLDLGLADRKISRKFEWQRINRAKSWTFQRFRAAIDLGGRNGGSSS
jgi:hypothetical protein